MSEFLSLAFAWEVFISAIATIAFSVLFFVPRKYYALCGICGAVGWVVYRVMTTMGISATEATFFATVAVIFLSRLFAVMERCPATLFLIPGIFPLVPGAGVYWTSYHIVTNDLAMASETGFAALKAAVAIVLGIIFVFEIPQNVFAALARIGKQKA